MKRTALVLLLLSALAAPAAAQDTPLDNAQSTLQKGRWAIGFGWPFNADGFQSQFEVWRMTTDRSNVGLTLDLQLSDTNGNETVDHSSQAIQFGPALRRYLSKQDRIAPFVQIGAVALSPEFKHFGLTVTTTASPRRQTRLPRPRSFTHSHSPLGCAFTSDAADVNVRGSLPFAASSRASGSDRIH